MSISVKRADVSGTFYPDNPTQLKNMINGFLEEAKEIDLKPKAIVAPHAGYIYSGPIAGTAYKTIRNIQDQVENIILLSPAHRHPFQGIATHSADKFETPLGQISVNMELIKSILNFPFVNNINDAFTNEHALEVHLPFIQTIFSDDKIKIVPMVVGPTNENEVMELLDSLWNDEMKNLIIVSTDLSHFHPYDDAQRIDSKTQQAIEALDNNALSTEQACGHYPLKGLLKLAKKRNLKPHSVDMRNSGDTAGDHSSVVGYGSFIFT